MKTLCVDSLGNSLRVRLHRPAERNAFDDRMVGELTEVFARLPQDVRSVVLTGEGEAFCAGADLRTMRASVNRSAAQNRADAEALAGLFEAVDGAPAVVVGRVNGVAMGGALGLLACCDVVAAIDTARFAFSEVRLGLAPAVIAPYVVRKIGMSQARRFFLTGELFGAHTAFSMGLVHKVVEPSRLDAAVEEWTEGARRCGPAAIVAIKALLRQPQLSDPEAARASTVACIAALRVSAEGQEGLNAFLHKRQPAWAG